MDNPHLEKNRFFGRKTSKPLSESKKKLLDNSKDILFELNENINTKDLFTNADIDNIYLEIGFGGGEHLLHQAKLYPNKAFIGCDAFITGQARVLRNIKENNIQNIRLYNGDALGLIKSLSSESLSGIYLLYPDPWPKKRHHKRRFIQKDTISIFHDILKLNGFFRFATDITDYIDWVFAHINDHGGFKLNHNHYYEKPFDDWVPTKYEQKALREGRNAHYFEFNKI